MKTLLFSYKFLFMTLMFLPLSLCSKDNEDDFGDNESEVVVLNTIRQTPIYNTSNGYQWNDVNYPNSNLSIMSYSTSNVIGEFGASDAEEELEIIMEIARKTTIDENKKKVDTVNYKRAWGYDLLDAVMNKSDYYITKKEGGTLFVTKDKKFRVEKYLLGSRYVPGFAFSYAGLFRSFDNGLDLYSTLNGNIYYTDDDVFSYYEPTKIPVYQYVDYRMLLHFRFLIRNGAKDISLKGIKEDGTEMSFTLNENSDLIALSDEFEANEIETIWFLAKGNYRVDYFNGIIFSNESGDNSSHEIEYRYGEPIFD
ncbi:hypothetical protein [Flavivirga sp. 57AJ16]|uniref:hypothetical protein n=1 Tax=Flavivirga sp. 57AJ16 TaxID=3025307 RepID=UPI002365165F|nr:hypothetical protein [Flavivirga sp. 57AJ16]MDD7887862.1 hypothetical protein [Flavivirga sp. 57AJ16]